MSADHVLQSPYGGPGIVIFSLGQCCRDSYMVMNEKAQLDFCLTCQKQTYACKYPHSQIIQSRVFYGKFLSYIPASPLVFFAGKRRECHTPNMTPGDYMWKKSEFLIVVLETTTTTTVFSDALGGGRKWRNVCTPSRKMLSRHGEGRQRQAHF